MKHIYHYCFGLAGELQTNLFGVIKTIFADHTVNFRWKYRKEGF